MLDHSFRAFRVSETVDSRFASNIISRSISELPDNDVLIKVRSLLQETGELHENIRIRQELTPREP